jgi:hypothetical protein
MADNLRAASAALHAGRLAQAEALARTHLRRNPIEVSALHLLAQVAKLYLSLHQPRTAIPAIGLEDERGRPPIPPERQQRRTLAT